MSWAYQYTDGQLCAALNEGGAADGPKRTWRAFQPPGTPPQYARDRVVEVKHIRLEVRLDVRRKSVAGTVALTVRPIAGEVRALELDAAELRIARVRCAGRAVADFTATGDKLHLELAEPLPAGADTVIEVAYSATPRRGLYFVGPDRRDPRRRTCVWSQGQDEDNRYWFPCFDYPNVKATSELIAVVPGRWFCLSNGKLLSRRANRDGTATFHWFQDIPHSTYLISLAAGEYVERAAEWDGIPVNYYVPRGREADGARSFGRTPEMVAFFSKLIGVRYPFAKYAQITVEDFIFGGMENTTATTITERTLHDARAHLDFSSEPLVAHELAHSWFGDWLTCRDWSHAWLNESFATFFDNLWYRESRGEDEFRYEMYGDWRAYLAEDANHYRRPIVTNVYRAPVDLFDRHLYQKGACILNHLRGLLGDALFFRAVKTYVERFRAQNVTTSDFMGVLEDVTGRNFDAFFEQWLFKGGHPEFEFGARWDKAAGTVTLTIKQTQTADEMTPVFRLPVKVRFVGKDYDEIRTFEVREDEHTFHCVLPSRPRWLAFDPGNTIPKTIQLKLDEDQLAAQLEHDDDALGRVRAAQALGKKGTHKAVAALARALRADRFWGVQAECAAALAEVRSPEAFDALRAAVRLPHPKARRAVARALGSWRTDAAARAVAALARRDTSYLVEAEAAEALGRTRAARSWPALLPLLKRGSWQEVVRAGVLRGMAEADPTRAVPLLAQWSACGRPQPARLAALAVYGRAVRESAKTSDSLKLAARLAYEATLDDGFFFDRIAAMHGLRELRDPAAVPALARLKSATLDARLRRHAETAVEALRDAGGLPSEVRSLRQELDKMKEASAELKEQVEALEAKAKGKRKTRPSRRR